MKRGQGIDKGCRSRATKSDRGRVPVRDPPGRNHHDPRRLPPSVRASDLILASGSQRRADLLKQLGLRFNVRTAAVEEGIDSSEGPGQAVRRLARDKALAVAQDVHKTDPVDHERWVIGADTLGYLDGHILGKPHDERHAYEMLERLEGRTHLVLTGVAVVCIEPGKRLGMRWARDGAKTTEQPGVRFHEWGGFQETKVRFTHLPRRTMKAYVDSGEPMGKAAAYAIQGYADPFVESIEGSYSNVVGLPTNLTMNLLEAAGYKLPLRLRVRTRGELRAGGLLE